MAQKRVCICAYFLQHQPVEARVLLANISGVRVVLLDFDSIYCFNDLKDVEADRQHPKKCRRPIASGKVSVMGGYVMMILCTIGSLAILPLAQSPNTP